MALEGFDNTKMGDRKWNKQRLHELFLTASISNHWNISRFNCFFH